MKKKLINTIGITLITTTPFLTVISCGNGSTNGQRDPEYDALRNASALIESEYKATYELQDEDGNDVDASEFRPSQILEYASDMESFDETLQILGFSFDKVEGFTYEFQSKGTIGNDGDIQNIIIQITEPSNGKFIFSKPIRVWGFNKTLSISAKEIASKISSNPYFKAPGKSKIIPSIILSEVKSMFTFDGMLQKYGISISQTAGAKYSIEEFGIPNDNEGTISGIVIRVEKDGESVLTDNLLISGYEVSPETAEDIANELSKDWITSYTKKSIAPTQIIEESKKLPDFSAKIAAYGLDSQINQSQYKLKFIEYGNPTNDGKIEGVVLKITKYIGETVDEAITAPFTISGYKNDNEHAKEVKRVFAKLTRLQTFKLNNEQLKNFTYDPSLSFSQQLGIENNNELWWNVRDFENIYRKPVAIAWNIEERAGKSNQFVVTGNIDVNGAKETSSFYLRSSEFSIQDDLDELRDEIKHLDAAQKHRVQLPSEINIEDLEIQYPNYAGFNWEIDKSSVPVADDVNGVITGIKIKISSGSISVITGDVEISGFTTKAEADDLDNEFTKIEATPAKLKISKPTNPTTLAALKYSVDNLSANFTISLEDKSISDVTNGYKFKVVLQNEQGRQKIKEVTQVYNSTEEDIDLIKKEFEDKFGLIEENEINILPSISSNVTWSSLTRKDALDLSKIEGIYGVSLAYDVVGVDSRNGKVKIRTNISKDGQLKSYEFFITYILIKEANDKIEDALSHITPNPKLSTFRSTNEINSYISSNELTTDNLISKLGLSVSDFNKENDAIKSIDNIVWKVSDKNGHNFKISATVNLRNSSLTVEQRTISYILTSATPASNAKVQAAVNFIGTSKRDSDSRIYIELDDHISSGKKITKESASHDLGVKDLSTDANEINDVTGINYTLTKNSETSYTVKAIVEQGASEISLNDRTTEFELVPVVNHAYESIFKFKQYVTSNDRESSIRYALFDPTDITTDNAAAKLGITFNKDHESIAFMDSITWNATPINGTKDFMITIEVSATNNTDGQTYNDTISFRLNTNKNQNDIDEIVSGLRSYLDGVSKDKLYTLLSQNELTSTISSVNATNFGTKLQLMSNPFIFTNLANNSYLKFENANNNLVIKINISGSYLPENDLKFEFPIGTNPTNVAAIKALKTHFESVNVKSGSATLTKAELKALQTVSSDDLTSRLGIFTFNINDAIVAAVGKDNIVWSISESSKADDIFNVKGIVNKNGYILDAPEFEMVFEVASKDSTSEAAGNIIKTNLTNYFNQFKTSNNYKVKWVDDKNIAHKDVPTKLNIQWLTQNTSRMSQIAAYDGTINHVGASITWSRTREGFIIYTHYLTMNANIPGVGAFSVKLQVNNQ